MVAGPLWSVSPPRCSQQRCAAMAAASVSAAGKAFYLLPHVRLVFSLL